MREILNLFAKKPLLVVFEVTKYCNQTCPMCSIPIRKKHREMGLREIEKVFKKLRKFGAKEVFLQGGEPLLRKDIFEIMLLLKKLGFSQHLVSNGLLLDETAFKFLSKNKIGLSVSLDTLDPKKYKKIRGADCLGKVLLNLSLAKKFRHGRSWNIHATVSKLNAGEVFDVKRFAEKNGFDFSALPYIYGVGIAGTKREELLYKKEVLKVFEKLAKQEKDFFKKIAYLEAVKFLRGESIGACDALRYSIKVDETGKLAPCIEMPAFLNLIEEEPEKMFDKKQLAIVESCSKNTPCFYGCTRSIGSIAKNKKKVCLHPLQAVSSLKKIL